MDKLNLARRNLGLVFNFRYGCLFSTCNSSLGAKLPIFKCKNCHILLYCSLSVQMCVCVCVCGEGGEWVSESVLKCAQFSPKLNGDHRQSVLRKCFRRKNVMARSFIHILTYFFVFEFFLHSL